MIPIIGTCLRVVEVGVIPSMVVRDGTMTWFVPVTTLVGQSTISTLVPIQQAVRPAPVTGGPFSFFLFEGKWYGRVRWGKAKLGPSGRAMSCGVIRDAAFAA
jgi:hypothetical protein